MPTLVDKNWITSKELLLKTGISRATLNNYIAIGIIPKPVVKRPPGDMKRPGKIGYFPEEAVERIEIVKRLKREGNSMEEIARKFEDVPSIAEPFRRRRTDNGSADRLTSGIPERSSKITDTALTVTIEDIHFPAYLINTDFEIEWINSEAEDQVFSKPIRSIAELESRNIFRLFFTWEFHDHMRNWEEIVAFHLAFAKPKFPKSSLPKLYQGISKREISTLEKIYDRKPPSSEKSISHTAINFVRQDGSIASHEVYTVFFREGIFFVYVPAEKLPDRILELLSCREKVITKLLSERMPSLVSLCVLVADVEDSVRMSVELPPAEYFELINQLRKTLAGSFEKYNGVFGKHAGDGMLYYFIKKPGSNYLMNAIRCALELRKKVSRFSNEWKMRKGWLNEIYLNIGINEGKEFFGTIYSGSNIEFTALGDSINYAARLSDLANSGAIWTAKNVINKLSSEEVKEFRFGVRRRERDREIFVENSFSRVIDLLDPNDPRYSKFMDIATLAVAEILDKEAM